MVLTGNFDPTDRSLNYLFLTSVMAKALKKQVLLLAQAGDVDGLKNISSQSSIHWLNCLLPTGDTPLHVAAQHGREEVIRFLLEHWLSKHNNVDVISASGKTALHEAAQFARPEIVSLLLEKGANPRALKQADWTPLMLACTKTGVEAVKCCKLLFNAGGRSALADRNKDGWSVLHLASREGDIEIVKWILSLDPNLIISQSKNGRTPLHTAALHGHTDVVSLLLQTGLTGPNVQDSCGSSPVHDAVRSGSVDTLIALTSCGGDLKLTNALGQSVIHMAAETGDSNMLQYLLEKCDLHADFGEFTSTPLHCAIKAGKAEAVETLLRHDANVQAIDACGYSCLDIAKTSKCSATQDLINAALSLR